MNKFAGVKIGSFMLFSIVISCIFSSVLTFYFIKKDALLSKQRNKEVVVRLVEEVWSKGNLAMVDELVSPHYLIRHDPGDKWEGKTIDLASFKERVSMSRHILPDQKFYIEDLVCEGDKVAVSWRFTGTQKGDLPGLPAKNNTVNISGLTIYYLSNGKITGHWQVFDKLGLMTQLGS